MDKTALDYDDIPECDCPTRHSLLGDSVKSHVPDCPTMQWFHEIFENIEDEVQGSSPGGGFIATPSMQDVKRLAEAIEELRSRIVDLEEHINKIELEARRE